MCKFWKVFSATVSRLLFFVHGFLMVWMVVSVKRCTTYWILLLGVGALIVEMGFTLKFTKNGEWKWFSPMVSLYLSTAIPALWLLELDLLEKRLFNSSSDTTCYFGPMIPGDANIYLQLYGRLSSITTAQWVTGLEQIMLLVLVLGRWLMPKGDMTRYQLSQLLMVHLGLGADILDIFDLFKHPTANTDKLIVIAGLSFCSWATIQFQLVLAHTKSQEPRAAGAQTKEMEEERSACCCKEQGCCTSKVWSLLITIVTQDGPFLAYRLYFLIVIGFVNQTMIFFLSKNSLVVLLEIYRRFVMHCQQQGHHRCPRRKRQQDK
uniref:Transmembrane protein 26 n=2 Tax=Latimeria chalumnae TaxID=7897 RepID=H3BIP0_LATCH